MTRVKMNLPDPACIGCAPDLRMQAVGSDLPLAGYHQEGCPDHDKGFIHDGEFCVMCGEVWEGRPFEVSA